MKPSIANRSPYGAEIRLAVVEPFEAVCRRSVSAGKIVYGSLASWALHQLWGAVDEPGWHNRYAYASGNPVNDAAGELVAHYLALKGDPLPLIVTMGIALVREDRNFHTLQTLEVAVRQFEYWRGTLASGHALITAARYIAAHAPTARADTQTFEIARRQHRGEKVFEG